MSVWVRQPVAMVTNFPKKYNVTNLRFVLYLCGKFYLGTMIQAIFRKVFLTLLGEIGYYFEPPETRAKMFDLWEVGGGGIIGGTKKTMDSL